MREFFFFSMLLVLVTNVELSSFSKEWCGIVPLHSTRADVERLLKVKPSRCGGNACLYDLPDKTVFALYAEEPTCKNIDVSSSWKVPRDTVIEITITFKTPQPLSLIDTDLTKFDRVPDKEFPALIYFTNDIEGVEMETSGNTVRRITYYRAKKDDELRCFELL